MSNNGESNTWYQKIRLLIGTVGTSYHISSTVQQIISSNMARNLVQNIFSQTMQRTSTSTSQNNNMSSQEPPTRHILNPQEEALRALCSRTLKSQLFRGYFIGRHFVDDVNGYRDIVALQRSEKYLKKLLINVYQKYQDSSSSKWFGIKMGNIPDVAKPAGAINAYIWTELNDLVSGQYWFSIQDISFREHEIILELKMVRPVEDATSVEEETTAITIATYKNIIELVKIMGYAIKYIFEFTLRFMAEISRLTRALTPITVQLIIFLGKIIGGLYILVAMVFKGLMTLITNHGEPQPMYNRVEFSRPRQRAIEYNVPQQW